MNSEGISVFYGATDVDTCIAEIRAPVGGYVVIGRLLPLRELCLLDLMRLEKVLLQVSPFDAEHTESLSRVHFFRQLVAKLSQPVMPGSESMDYLPTQVVAEYLKAHPDMKLDGMMFASSQTARAQEEDADTREQKGKNVVLFSHACGLEEYDTSIREIVPYTQEIEDNVTREIEGNATSLHAVVDRWNQVQSSSLPENPIDARIRLDMESV